jgi:ribosomal protein S18 acetylase RimI-like enzyme
MIHRHLDWRRPEDWLGKQPFLLYLSHDHSIKAILNCVSEPKNIHWIRLFAFKDPLKKVKYWQALFKSCLEIINEQSSSKPQILSLAYQKWMKDLLETEGWTENQHVIQFRWENKKRSRSKLSQSPSPCIRPMEGLDISDVSSVDQACFDPFWQNTYQALEHAFFQSGYATVYENEQTICGYQISTYDNEKAHLARLAVHPSFQNQHIGEKLVIDMMKHAIDSSIKEITINTQNDNNSSIGLYTKLDFKKTGDSFPIYKYP